jgi:hypothetical protein
LHNSLAIGGQKDKDRMPVSHILHVAACPPDSTQRPAWNTLQHLDTVSWNTLPLELQKVSTFEATFDIDLIYIIEEH